MHLICVLLPCQMSNYNKCLKKKFFIELGYWKKVWKLIFEVVIPRKNKKMSLTVDAVDVANAVELPTTDSYGSRSDVSLKYVPTRPKMDVVCVIDLHGTDRKKAYEDVKVACAAINTHNISLTHIQVST